MGESGVSSGWTEEDDRSFIGKRGQGQEANTLCTGRVKAGLRDSTRRQMMCHNETCLLSLLKDGHRDGIKALCHQRVSERAYEDRAHARVASTRGVVAVIAVP